MQLDDEGEEEDEEDEDEDEEEDEEEEEEEEDVFTGTSGKITILLVSVRPHSSSAERLLGCDQAERIII